MRCPCWSILGPICAKWGTPIWTLWASLTNVHIRRGMGITKSWYDCHQLKSVPTRNKIHYPEHIFWVRVEFVFRDFPLFPKSKTWELWTHKIGTGFYEHIYRDSHYGEVKSHIIWQISRNIAISIARKAGNFQYRKLQDLNGAKFNILTCYSAHSFLEKPFKDILSAFSSSSSDDDMTHAAATAGVTAAVTDCEDDVDSEDGIL
jgi:hypothetical protein